MAKDIQPTATKHSAFEVYRYQLVVNKTLQLSQTNMEFPDKGPPFSA